MKIFQFYFGYDFFWYFSFKVETDTEDVLGEAAMENRRPPSQKGG